MFWHWIWIENGRPRLGHIADIMRLTRAKYHYTVRYTKRCENDRRKRKMAESVSTNNQRDLWLETKKLTSIKMPSTHVVDGACSPEDISEVFVTKYETLFQSIPTDANDLQSIYRDIRAGVEYDDKCYSSITVGDIIDGLKSIKHGKQDGLTSDHLVNTNSSNKFKIVLSMVMSSMMVHGYNSGVDLGGIPLSRAPQIFRRNTRFAGTVIRSDYQLLPRFGDPILGLASLD